MTQTKLVFSPSEALVGYLEQLYSQHAAAPQKVHTDAMRGIVEHFIDEVNQAFFLAPIEAIEAEGSVVNIILKGVGVIRKTGRSLALRLLDRITTKDQAGLVAHFKRLHFQHEGQHYVGFSFAPEVQAQVTAVFAKVHENEEVPIDSLVEAFQQIADAALYHYMDSTMEAIEVKAFSRGLIRAARATIKKSTSVAINRGIPALGTHYRRGLVKYFEDHFINL